VVAVEPRVGSTEQNDRRRCHQNLRRAVLTHTLFEGGEACFSGQWEQRQSRR
jgi:hypothetical protein